MERLLRRVRGEDLAGGPTPPAPTVTQEAPRPASAAEVKEETKQEESVEKLDEASYAPRSTAPESSSNLRAMRDLANDSARSAISTHAQRAYAVSVRRKRLMGWSAGTLCSVGALMFTLGNNLCGALVIPAAVVCYLWLRQSNSAAQRLQSATMPLSTPAGD